MRRGRRKIFVQKREGLFRKAHEEAEMQRKALRRGKNLAQSRYMLKKEMSAVEGDPLESWSGIEVEGELNKKKLSWRLAWWGSTEKKEASRLLRLRERHQYSCRMRDN